MSEQDLFHSRATSKSQLPSARWRQGSLDAICVGGRYSDIVRGRCSPPCSSAVGTARVCDRVLGSGKSSNHRDRHLSNRWSRRVAADDAGLVAGLLRVAGLRRRCHLGSGDDGRWCGIGDQQTQIQPLDGGVRGPATDPVQVSIALRSILGHDQPGQQRHGRAQWSSDVCRSGRAAGPILCGRGRTAGVVAGLRSGLAVAETGVGCDPVFGSELRVSGRLPHRRRGLGAAI